MLGKVEDNRMGTVIIPEGYKSCLSTYETQEAIGNNKNLMQISRNFSAPKSAS